jgi:hypothetical protein
MSKTFFVGLGLLLDFFCLSRFRVFLSDGFKNTTKSALQKSRVEKFLQKIGKTNPDFVYHVFGRFSVRRAQKLKNTTQKCPKKNRP